MMLKMEAEMEAQELTEKLYYRLVEIEMILEDENLCPDLNRAELKVEFEAIRTQRKELLIKQFGSMENIPRAFENYTGAYHASKN